MTYSPTQDALLSDIRDVLRTHERDLRKSDVWEELHDLLLGFLDEKKWKTGDVLEYRTEGRTVEITMDANLLRFIDYLLESMEV